MCIYSDSSVYCRERAGLGFQARHKKKIVACIVEALGPQPRAVITSLKAIWQSN